MVKAYWIGIDGGGTKTTAVIGNRSGQIMAMYYGESGNLTAISIEQLYERLNDIIEHLLMKADVEIDSVEIIFAAFGPQDAYRTGANSGAVFFKPARAIEPAPGLY